MKFYTDKSHYKSRNEWQYVVHFVKPFFKMTSYSHSELVEQFGDYFDAYECTDDISEAEFSMLPMTLEYYLSKGKKKQLYGFIDDSRAAGKKVIAFTMGDFGVKFDEEGVIVFSQNGYQSKRLPNHHILPPVFRDPLLQYYSKTDIYLRKKTETPVVGFDGLAYESIPKMCLNLVRTCIRNIKYYLGLSIEIPNVLYSTVKLRSNVLKFIQKDKRIVTNFNIRNKYKVGGSESDDRRKKTLEFYDNMIASDYVVCVRGLGNFSKRFYETLAMGRIPIFINTDCVLPFDNIIDWRKYCVWVEKKEIYSIGDKIVEHYNSLSDEDFITLQKECRKLWCEYLSGSGAMRNLSKYNDVK